MINSDNFSGYEDIIYLPVPHIWVRPRMSPYNRAVQFAPFAALTGFDEMVKKMANSVEKKEGCFINN